ncbi:MobF family relaxase [Beijerinckia mobilis]|uniref:MobF family relaxase n=1 Tax=Beijerinckia mobilis TaxID=231434 RepID=UPI00054FFF3A|nr:MobF family relaxase [Beijerinckia mobilis]
MMNFRKIAADSQGVLLRTYFTEGKTAPIHDPAKHPEKPLEPGSRLTSYYTGRDSRATWRPDITPAFAKAVGIDPSQMPTSEVLDRLFEGKRGDNGEQWSKQERKLSGFDFTFSPHKSVTLAAEFAATPAESAAIWNAIDRANDAAMRYAAGRLGFARRGKGGEEGVDPGDVGWVSFRHHVARPTVELQDGKSGATYLVEAKTAGDPQAHIHNFFMNMVVTADGRVGSLNTKELTSDLIHELGGFFQGRLADELRRLGAEIGYDRKDEAVVLEAIPQKAVDTFSKRRQQVLRSAKAFAKSQGLDWDELSIERKQTILNESSVVSRYAKQDGKGEKEAWKAQAEAIGWRHETVLTGAKHETLSDAERYDRAYDFAAKRLAEDFKTAAVLNHDRLRVHAVRGLIGSGMEHGRDDIDRVVALLKQRGLSLHGEHVALITSQMEDKVRITNTAQIRIETELANKARAVARDKDGALSAQTVKAAINASGLDFTSEPEHGAAQRAAIHAFGEGGRLTLLTGVAGSGKTTLLQPLVAAWKADTRYDAAGREVIGVATAWRQADALKDAGIEKTVALQPFLQSLGVEGQPDTTTLAKAGIEKTAGVDALLQAIDKGTVKPTHNTVLVIDEVSQIGPRAMLKLLEVQAETGMTIKALGDREQAQAIEAGDTIEILKRVLPKEALPELLTTVRQRTRRDRDIANLFREGKAGEALGMKIEDGTARLLGGDQDQVIGQIADLYMQRRDILRTEDPKKSITVSALTNQDAADISQAIRERLKARGEIGADEKLYKAIDQRGETYDLRIATGDKLRLYRRTWATIDGKGGSIGDNGDIVEVVGRSADGFTFKDKKGRIGSVEMRRLIDPKTQRLMLGYGHALTIDAAQGLTSEEHINALPRGSAGISSFKGYVAESRSRGATWTLVSGAAVHEAEKRSRALGDASPVTTEDIWKRVAADMATKNYKPLATDLIGTLRRHREQAVDTLLTLGLRAESNDGKSKELGRDLRQVIRAKVVQEQVDPEIVALNAAIKENGKRLDALSKRAASFLQEMQAETQEQQRKLAEARQRNEATPSPSARR